MEKVVNFEHPTYFRQAILVNVTWLYCKIKVQNIVWGWEAAHERHGPIFKTRVINSLKIAWKLKQAVNQLTKFLLFLLFVQHDVVKIIFPWNSVRRSAV